MDLFIITERWQQHNYLFTGDFIKKPLYIYTTEYHSAIKKRLPINIFSNMDDLKKNKSSFMQSSIYKILFIF